jgi:hypothetical protein
MMPGHAAVVLEFSLNALVCLVQVAELAAGDFLQAHFLGGAPHPDMEGAATLQRPGGVLLPAVLPGWTLGRAGARWWADRGPHPCHRDGRLSGRGGAGPPAARQPPVPVPVRCTGSRAAQRTGQVAKRWLGCPDGVSEASCCACNGMALSCVFSSLGSQCCALRPLPRASAG